MVLDFRVRFDQKEFHLHLLPLPPCPALTSLSPPGAQEELNNTQQCNTAGFQQKLWGILKSKNNRLKDKQFSRSQMDEVTDKILDDSNMLKLLMLKKEKKEM